MQPRQLNIINILLEEKDYVTIKEISDDLNVSVKTIRNDLDTLCTKLYSSDVQLERKTGVGVRLLGSHEAKLSLSSYLKRYSITDYSPKQRMLYIGLQSTLYKNVSITNLQKELNVSKTTIYSDIESFEEYALCHKVEITRNYNSLKIVGSEKNIRNLMFDMMMDDNHSIKIFKVIEDPNFECSGDMIIPGLEMTDDALHEFSTCITKSNIQDILKLDFYSLVSIILRLIIVFERTQEAALINLSMEFVKEIQEKPFLNIAQQLLDRVGNHYNCLFNKLEVFYVQVYLISYKKSDFDNSSTKNIAYMFANELIDTWILKHDISATCRIDLKDSIYNHMCPAITRYRHGIPNENPLLSEIQSTYPVLYAFTKESVEIVQKDFSIVVDCADIGYLTLYLKVALDKSKSKVRAILVSNCGKAATKLLEQRLRTQIYELKIVDSLDILSFYKHKLDCIDLIITTVELNNDSLVPQVVINSLIKEHDIIALRNIIKEV